MSSKYHKFVYLQVWNIKKKKAKKEGGRILHQLAMFTVMEMVVILSPSFTPVTPFSRYIFFKAKEIVL